MFKDPSQFQTAHDWILSYRCTLYIEFKCGCLPFRHSRGELGDPAGLSRECQHVHPPGRENCSLPEGGRGPASPCPLGGEGNDRTAGVQENTHQQNQVNKIE